VGAGTGAWEKKDPKKKKWAKIRKWNYKIGCKKGTANRPRQASPTTQGKKPTNKGENDEKRHRNGSKDVFTKLAMTI